MTDEIKNIYERVEAWKKIEVGKATRFQCVKRLSDGMFAVQNADFFHLPLKTIDIQLSNARFVELFLEEDPTERCQFWRRSLDEAITEHEKYFADIGER